MFGPTLTASVPHAHNTAANYSYDLTLCSHEPGELSVGPLPTERGRSPTPLLPLELGSGAQVISQIHKENIIMRVSAPKSTVDQVFQQTVSLQWAGTDAADRPSASAPEDCTNDDGADPSQRSE